MTGENKKIIAFCCAESAYRAADRAGRLRIRYPDNVRLIRVPCAGRVSVLHILKAFEKGAAGVLVMGCQEGACCHLTGNTRAKERVKKASALLKEIGIDGNRVRMVNLAPENHQQFVQEVSKLSEKLKELGPSPIRKGEVKK